VLRALFDASPFRLLLPRFLDGCEVDVELRQRLPPRDLARRLTSSAFERRFRDLHTVTQQLQGRQAHLETVGRYLLGLPPDQTFL